MLKNTTPVVNAIEQIHIEGDIIPKSWFKHIVYKTRKGTIKPNLLAIYILANIRFWYTPTIRRDEPSDEIISIVKKFDSDKLQKSYDSYAKSTGSSKRQIKAAFDLLKNLGLITIEFRNITVKDTKLFNVMYVEPVAEKILEITFNERKNVPPPTKICTTLLPKSVTLIHRLQYIDYSKKLKREEESDDSSLLKKTPPEELFGEEKNHIGQSTSNSTPSGDDTKDGTKVEPSGHQVDTTQSLCTLWYRDRAEEVIGFLYSIDYYKNEKHLFNFVQEIFSLYDVELLWDLIGSFKEKIKKTKIQVYNTNYVLEAFRREVKKMGEYVDGFRKWCLDKFGPGEGMRIFKFYSKLSQRQPRKKDVSWSAKNATEMKEKNIEHLIDTYGQNTFIRGIDSFTVKFSEGLLKQETVTMEYFTNYVKYLSKGTKNFKAPSQQNSLFDTMATSCIPTPIRKVEGENSTKEYRNWIYECVCGQEINPILHMDCPACGAHMEWHNVKIEKGSQADGSGESVGNVPS